MSRRALLFIVAAVLAITITATSAYVSIMFAPWKAGEPLLIVDPYSNISSYPYATISTIGNTIVMKFADVGDVKIVPFALVFTATPAQTIVSAPVSLTKFYTVCINVTVSANSTVSINIINRDVDPNTVSNYRSYYFGLIGLAVGKSLLDKYGYNNSFGVYTIVRKPDYGGDYDEYIIVRSCSFYNSTHMNCTVDVVEYTGYLRCSYTIWLVNKTVTSIGGDTYFIYLVKSSEIGKLLGPDETCDFYAVDTKYPGPGARLTTLSFNGTSGTLRICMFYGRGDPAVGKDRPPFLPVFPVIGAYMDISVQSLGTELNMTISSISSTFIQLG